MSFDQVIDRLLASKELYYANYLAMYSSWYGGIITVPALMMIPLDDHMVHRGDGVFEAFKCMGWNIYALDRHLERMTRSLAASTLTSPVERERLVEIIRETVRAGNSADCIIRLFISRGPGSFSANPYESIGSQLFVMVTAYHPTASEKYERGVTLATSSIPLKNDIFATVKTCNYLQNALMKKEASDVGADFPVSLDEQGFLAEGATENIGIVTKEREFLVPRFQRTLRGITVTRVLELAAGLVGTELSTAGEADITHEQAYNAAEVFVFGTSFGILPVVRFDGKKIGEGKPGPVFMKLLEIFRRDQSSNPRMLTPVNS